MASIFDLDIIGTFFGIELNLPTLGDLKAYFWPNRCLSAKILYANNKVWPASRRQATFGVQLEN